MNVMPTAVTIFRNGTTARNSLATTVSVRLISSSGTRPDQNFDHRKSRYVIGAVLIIQNAAPSRRDRRKHESRRNSRHHESREPQIEERVEVLDQAGHVRNAIEIEHLEVVEIHHDERDQQKQLRPLGDVAQERPSHL